MSLDVVTAGEAMVQFAAEQSGPLDQIDRFVRISAGAELNVAIGLARLGLGVGYISRLGQDSFGRFLAATLDREGIDRTQVGVNAEQPTGFMLKSRSDDGSDPQIEYFRRGSAASRLGSSPALLAYATAARHLHLTGIYVAVSPTTRELVFALAAAARAAGRTVSFDPNLRPSLWRTPAEMVECLNRLAAFADWVLPGLEEGRRLTGRDSPQAIADFYLERGARGVVVKLGPAGAYFANAEQRGSAPGLPVERVVDTVGAGDGFAVGVISALLEGLPLAAAAARGNAIGARVVQFPGDCDGLPTRDELNALVPYQQDGRSIVFMGVSGCGKSSLAAAVSAALKLPLVEGDDFHGEGNRSKMTRGVALTDADRRRWLDALADVLRAGPDGVVLTCSALKRAYRDRLRAASSGLRFVFMDLSQDEAQRRVQARAAGHFFPPDLVASQFATLESPLGEAGVLRVDACARPADQLAEVRRWLRSSAADGQPLLRP